MAQLVHEYTREKVREKESQGKRREEGRARRGPVGFGHRRKRGSREQTRAAGSSGSGGARRQQERGDGQRSSGSYRIWAAMVVGQEGKMRRRWRLRGDWALVDPEGICWSGGATGRMGQVPRF